MKKCTKCGETKSPEGFHRRSYAKDGLMSECKPCTIERNEQWRAANPDAHRARVAKWRARNPARAKQADREWAGKNRERVNASSRRYTARNPGKSTASSAAYYKAHPSKATAKAARYKALRLKATTKWASGFIISEAYDLARLRAKATGIEWEVDHIVPLQSKLVCGLHCEANLQVIPAVANNKKGNRHWPDMPQQISV